MLGKQMSKPRNVLFTLISKKKKNKLSLYEKYISRWLIVWKIAQRRNKRKRFFLSASNICNFTGILCEI